MSLLRKPNLNEQPQLFLQPIVLGLEALLRTTGVAPSSVHELAGDLRTFLPWPSPINEALK